MTTMNPSQHYPDEDGEKPNVKSVAPEARFQASGYKDVWAAILFLIATAAFGFVSYLGITFLRIRLTDTQGLSLSGSLELAVRFGIAIACGGLFGLGFFMLLQIFAGKKLIVITMVVNTLCIAVYLSILTVIYPEIYVLLACSVVVFGLVATMNWYYWSNRSKIVFLSNQAVCKAHVK